MTSGMTIDIEQLLEQLTLEEKASLLAGSAMWHTTPVERLNIPAIKVSDGPNGARGSGGFAGSTTAACFPCGISLAATWNVDIVHQIGAAIGEEAKTKGAHILLGPTANIHRSPLNGRNFECYSEDPFLSARMAVAYIRGLQSQHVGACIKHYVCNDSEFERNTIDSIVGERALREIYLPPFKAAVQEADTWGIMSAYNKVNGIYASENPYTLLDILRDEWGFEGIVMSDWFGTKSTAASVNGGQDLEMPGPPAWRGGKLLAAAQAGEAKEEAITDSARRMLYTIQRAGAFEDPTDSPEQAIDNPAHRMLIRQAAAEGIVLLKNEGEILPIDPAKSETVAVIGPNARTAQIMGGGSAQVNTHYRVSPYESLLAKVGEEMEVAYAIGTTNHKSLPVLEAAWLATQGGQGGFAGEYYDNLDLAGSPVFQEAIQSSERMWFGEFSPDVDINSFSARFTGTITAPESGRYTFSLISVGLTRLLLDGQQVIDNWDEQQPGDFFFGMGSAEVTYEVDLQAGQEVELVIEYSKSGTMPLSIFRVGCLPPMVEDTIGEAVALAAQSDIALVYVGHSGEWETEGHDRPDMELVCEQNDLVEAVAAVNPNTVVILNTGAPITMPWIDKVAAVLQAWFPGQECGNAITDVLFGDVTPSGKLPQTFPKRLEDNPAFINYPGENGKVTYGEGLFVGYRYYEKKLIEPLFPFGFGLSYTTFEYSNLQLSTTKIPPDEILTVSIDVTNSGNVTGKEIVQLYIADPLSSLVRPEKELKAFAKVTLEPGETQTATMTIDKAALAYFDDLEMSWIAEAGTFEVRVGASSQDIRATASFELQESASFDGPEKEPIALSIESTMKDLLAHEEAKAVLSEHLPDFMDAPQLGMMMGFTLLQLQGMAADLLTDEVLGKINEGLRGIR
ncbi:MAG: glycoside hydrolase family 3 C-terminal domain-containing protein [Chloroflexota bacterium]